MNDLQTNLVVMTALAVSGMGLVGFVGWLLHGRVTSEAETLQDQADELQRKSDDQASRLAEVSSELHRTRVDLAALHGAVDIVRKEVDMIAHGPPSLRAPQGARGERHEGQQARAAQDPVITARRGGSGK